MSNRCILITLLAASLMLFNVGCADSAISLIEEARTESEIKENALELETLPETTAEAEVTPTQAVGEHIAVPFLDRDGGGDFNAIPAELVYSLNIFNPDAPFKNEEQLRYGSYRFTNKNGLLLCMQVNANTAHPCSIVVAGAACEPEQVAEVQNISALLFRMVNENTSAEQAQAFLEAMGATATAESELPSEPIIKYSETMTYEHGVYNGVFYMAIGAKPAEPIPANYDVMFTAPAPEEEPEPSPELDDGSIASAMLGSMDVKVIDARGGVTKNGTSYIGIRLEVTNTGPVKASLASSCYLSIKQADVEMEELTFVTQEINSGTPIESGATVEVDLFYKCIEKEYTGIRLQMKALMGSSEDQILINF